MPNYILTIDQGNTNTKLALFKRDADLDSTAESIFSFKQLEQIIEAYQLSDSNTVAILSSVKPDLVETPFKTISIQDYFKEQTFLDMPVSYTETLGIDRLALAYPLYKKNLNSICIDSGTFTTIDFISTEGFCGGYILPGLALIQNAYSEGSQLQKPNTNKPTISETNSIPHSTIEAIEQGSLISFMAPIRDVIFKDTQAEVITTGGNAKIISNLDRKVTYRENLIHESLFFIAKEIL
jgi:type III pantothenate kinase